MTARPAPHTEGRAPSLSLAMPPEGPPVFATLPASRTNDVLLFLFGMFAVLSVALIVAQVVMPALAPTFTAGTGVAVAPAGGGGFRIDPDAVLDASRFDDLRARA